MAFSTNVYPNLVDWANMANPDGTIADIAWLLAQANDIVKDMIFQEANSPFGHKVTVNAGLPQGIWRGNNQGTPSSKPQFAQYTFAMGMLSDYSKVDKEEANLYGQVGKFRWTQDQSHIEGMGQQIATASFYSSEDVNPNQFTGLSRYYNTITLANSQTARNVINGGGTGSSNTSMWLVGWGDNTIHMLHPKGSPAGLVYEDKGDVRELYDNNGNGFEGYTSYFAWKIGMCIKNWQYAVRMGNLDTTTAGLLGVSPPDLNTMLIQAANLLPTSTRRLSGIEEVDAPGDPKPGINPAIYVNRTVKTQLEIQAVRQKNVLINMSEYAGEVVLMWRDVPVRVCDSLINTESAIS